MMNHAACQLVNTPTSLPTVTPYQRVTPKLSEETVAESATSTEVSHSAKEDSQKTTYLEWRGLLLMEQ